MSLKTKVQLETLPEMRVVSFHGFGINPEELSGQKLRAWIDAHQLTDHVESLRIFGFNNPDPAEGSPNYGYEHWMTLPEGFQPQKDETLKTLEGGLYAMLGFENATPEMFGPTWKALGEWRLASSYIYDDSRQWLEECLTPKALLNIEEGLFSFNCYMPIKEK